MGKGTIISGGDDGQYSVKLIMNRERIDIEIARLNQQISKLEGIIDDYTSQIIIALNDGNTALANRLTAERGVAKLQKTSCQKKIDYLGVYAPDDPTVSAWCVDLTEDLSGSVGTIEVPGERGTVLIQPGYDGNAVYDSTRDGQLTPYPACSPANLFYNLAMLPGWQTWKPTYRIGTISNIDNNANTCTVTLESAESSQQSLDINQSNILTGVEFEYMQCNSSAFENGDCVIVKFIGQDFDSPKVIGFETEPKPCGFFFILTRDDDEVVTDSMNCTFTVKNSLGVEVGATAIYLSDTQQWQVILDNPEDYDENGHWVEYEAQEYSILTQYPFKYKADDKQDTGDLILYGEYEDHVPYWHVEDMVESTPFYDINAETGQFVMYYNDYEPCTGNNIGPCMRTDGPPFIGGPNASNVRAIVSDDWTNGLGRFCDSLDDDEIKYILFRGDTEYRKSYTVKSSIPYNIKRIVWYPVDPTIYGWPIIALEPYSFEHYEAWPGSPIFAEWHTIYSWRNYEGACATIGSDNGELFDLDMDYISTPNLNPDPVEDETIENNPSISGKQNYISIIPSYTTASCDSSLAVASTMISIEIDYDWD